MKWVSFEAENTIHSGIVLDGQIRDLGAEPLERWLASPEDITPLLATLPARPLDMERLCQPIMRPGKILGIGLNYRDHAAETGRTPPAVQTWFVKQATAANRPYGSVHMPAVSDQLDYEAELVVVIGRYGRHVPVSRAMEIVAGFTCGNDYSVRDWQRASPTMNMGKGFDTHAPFGPWIVSPDDLGPISELGVRSYVNGELRQNGCAGDMIFSVAEQIAHLSAAFTLEPGDLLFTGTPAGVGAAFEPPKFVKPGDEVRVEIDGIGDMLHTISKDPGEIRIGKLGET